MHNQLRMHEKQINDTNKFEAMNREVRQHTE